MLTLTKLSTLFYCMFLIFLFYFTCVYVFLCLEHDFYNNNNFPLWLWMWNLIFKRNQNRSSFGYNQLINRHCSCCKCCNGWDTDDVHFGHTGWRKKTGPAYLIANILKTPWPNCMEIGELLQYYMLNTVIIFLFKNFIALWRHLAKTQLLCDAQIYLYNVNKRQ